MKNILLHTDRLMIRDLKPAEAHLAVSFLLENRDFHERWDPQRPDEFFSLREQHRVLRSSRQDPNGLRVWLLPRGGAVAATSREAEANSGTAGEPAVLGMVTVSSIVRGFFQSAFLGYKLDHRAQGKGYMREALGAVIDFAFNQIGLHRLEANVMPLNERSLRLVAGLGFREEGRAKRYLFINGQWEDHLHMVILREEWRSPT